MYWMSKSRYRGTVLLALAILMAGFLNFLFSQYRMLDFPAANPKEEIRVLDSLLALMQGSGQSDENDDYSEFQSVSEQGSQHFKTFNPNTIKKEDWLAMGLPEKAFESLGRYRQKGGVFRRAEQLSKIPHLNRKQAEELMAFVRLDTGSNLVSRHKFVKEPKKPTGPFDLNLADSLQLKSVFGIGSKTASRILRYREDLGGFVQKNQLYEVWGLDSLVAEELMETSFLTSPPGIRKINPNTAIEEELVKHPYIRKGLGRLVVRYRKQHPPFTKPEDLLGIRLFRTEQLEKLRPYLEF
jgi:DNA uptake protein ComE-like DNA-binding protein